VPWLQEGGQVRLVGSASMDGFVKRTISSWFFLSTVNFDVLLTVHLSICISVFNQIDARNFVLQLSFILCFYMFRAPRAQHQEVKIVEA